MVSASSRNGKGPGSRRYSAKAILHGKGHDVSEMMGENIP
jgi:hypothetical protein